MKILYFAWLKEHTGCATEIINVPPEIKTIGEWIPFIASKSSGHKTALGNMKAVRIAVNRVYADMTTTINDDDEIAFFPPVTGG